jgi:hypothetical protein
MDRGARNGKQLSYCTRLAPLNPLQVVPFYLREIKKARERCYVCLDPRLQMRVHSGRICARATS